MRKLLIALLLALLPSVSFAAYNDGVVTWNTRKGAVVMTAADVGAAANFTCPSHQWAESLPGSGVWVCTQPSFSDISGTITLGQLPTLAFSNITGQATLAQLPNIAADTLLCNSTGSSAVPQACTLAAPFGFSGTTFQLTGIVAAANGGTGVATASANTVLAGPTSGSAAAMAPRGLVVADLPAITDNAQTTSYTIAASDMNGTISLGGTGGTLTIPAISSTILPNGMAVCYSVQSGVWTLSSTPTINNLPSTRLTPPAGGCLVSNGTTLDWQPGHPGKVVIQVANAGTTGTTLNALAKLTGAPSTVVIAATTDTDNAIGIVVGGAGTTGNAYVATAGNAACIFDAATTAGDYVTISSTTAGDCHDIGASRPTATEVIGRVLSTNASAGTYAVSVQTSFLNTSGGGSGTVGSGTANQIAGYAASGTTVAGETVAGDCSVVITGGNVNFTCPKADYAMPIVVSLTQGAL